MFISSSNRPFTMRYIVCGLLLCLLGCRPSAPGVKNPNTGFERIPAEKSGLTHRFDIKDDYVYNFILDPYIYNGGGVAVIDVDNDGLQDLFFTARLQGCRLYRNKGNLQFEDISDKAGISQHGGLKTGACVVDINGDGWQDIYVCRTWLKPVPERRNLLLINNKNGTFSEQAAAWGLDDLSPSQQACFFDYDLDGDLDVYLMNHPVDFKSISVADFYPNSNCAEARCQAPKDEFESDRLYRNEGFLPGEHGDQKPFIDVSRQAGIWNRAFGLSVMCSDVNQDGFPDIFVGNDFLMPDFLYINNGKGGFTDQAGQYFRHSSNHSMGADIADLNNDGLQDLVVLDMLAEDWPRRRALMSTMILDRQKMLAERGYGIQQMRNTLQLNNGDGSFSEIGALAGMDATEWSWAPLVADFDHDGLKDLFISNGILRDLNDADFFLYTADSLNHTGGISQQRFGDFENFAKKIPSTPVHNYLYQNIGQFPFKDVSAEWGFNEKGFSNGAVYADLDNDGDLDLVTNNLNAPPALYANKTIGHSANHWLQIKCKGNAQNPMGIGAQVLVYAGGQCLFAQEMANVRGYYSAVEAIWQVGLGALANVDRIEIQWPNERYQVLHSIAADQRIVLDIGQTSPGRLPKQADKNQQALFESVSNCGLDFVHRENTFEDFDRERLLPHRLSTEGSCAVSADFNGDGQDDLFVGGAAGQAGGIWLGDKGKFIQRRQPALLSDAAFEDVGCLAFDADGDGDQDLYVVGGGNESPVGAAAYQDRLYVNDGNGNLARAANAIPAESNSGSAVAASDIDGDGDLDLAVGGRLVPGQYPLAPRSMLLRNDGGTFSDVTEQWAPAFAHAGMITDILFVDLNADGQKEMICCGEWMPVSIFSWKNNRFEPATEQWGLNRSNGWWNCLAAVDLDGDGDIDLAAGNEGLNIRFSAGETEPFKVWAADFDHNGTLDPLMAMAWEGRYVPVAQRNELLAQMPSLINKRYNRYRLYARASVEDIVSSSDLKNARQLHVNTFASGWFEQQNGQFIFHAFPWQAQTAPVRSILYGDWNKDQKTDLLCAGNHYGADVETGPLDAGCGTLLVGATNEFQWMPNRQHGFWAKQQARHLVTLRSGSQQFLVVVNCNGPCEVFKVVSR